MDKKDAKKHKKARKLKVDGKNLMEIISRRSMYADIEEMKDKGSISEEGDLPRSRFEKDRRERTAVLYEDREDSVEKSQFKYSIVVFYVCLFNMFSVLRQTVSTTQFRSVFYSQMQKKNNC